MVAWREREPGIEGAHAGRAGPGPLLADSSRRIPPGVSSARRRCRRQAALVRAAPGSSRRPPEARADRGIVAGDRGSEVDRALMRAPRCTAGPCRAGSVNGPG